LLEIAIRSLAALRVGDPRGGIGREVRGNGQGMEGKGKRLTVMKNYYFGSRKLTADIIGRPIADILL